MTNKHSKAPLTIDDFVPELSDTLENMLHACTFVVVDKQQLAQACRKATTSVGSTSGQRLHDALLGIARVVYKGRKAGIAYGAAVDLYYRQFCVVLSILKNSKESV